MLPFALSSTTAFGIFLAILMALGYVVIWALWHFVFSPRNRHDDDLDRMRSEEFLD